MFSKIYTFFRWNHHYKRWMARIKHAEDEVNIIHDLCYNYEQFLDIATEHIPEFKKVYKKIYPNKSTKASAKRLPTTATIGRAFQDIETSDSRKRCTQ